MLTYYGLRYFTRALIAGLMAIFLSWPAGVLAEDPLAAQAIQQRIEQHRMADITLTVEGKDGEVLADAEVTVEQTRHGFWFGSNAFRLSEGNTAYQERFAALFNFATLPFYWVTYEPTPGVTDQQRVAGMAKWCLEHNIIVKGHPLCWHQTLPQWVNGKTTEEFKQVQWARIGREMEAFKNQIQVWDVLNEVALTPEYQKETNGLARLCNEMGQDKLVAEVFAAARQAGKDKLLIINDFEMSEKNAVIIDRALKAGAPIDAIGLQSHMHQGYWEPQRTWEVCERFARFKKPLHFTELTIVSGEIKPEVNWQGNNPNWASTPDGEQRQAKQVEEFYRLVFSHPSVKAITWWDFSDQRAWLGAPAGLIHKDMSPKPAYEVLQRLIKKEWWTARQTLKTDGQGQIHFRGFLGDYQLETTGGVKAGFKVEQPGRQAPRVQLQ